MKEKSNLFWFALIGLIILASAAALFYFNKNSGTTAVIYQGNEEIYRINLSEIKEPKRLVITCDEGSNVVLLENGRISIVQADCPDKLCVEQGAITTGGVPIVCLPHKKRMAQTALTACERMVANAAPCTPIFNTKIRIGSRMMLVIAPITTVSMLMVEKPCAEMKAFMPRVS